MNYGTVWNANGWNIYSPPQDRSDCYITALMPYFAADEPARTHLFESTNLLSAHPPDFWLDTWVDYFHSFPWASTHDFHRPLLDKVK